MNRQLIEIASWRVACEIIRKHPDRIMIAELHPGGGMYDCLAIYDRRQPETSVHMNRPGSLHVFKKGDHQTISSIWEDVFEETNSKKIIDNVCSMLDLPEIRNVPASTPTTLVYRFIASFLAHSTLGLNKWQCRSGMCDTSGYGGGVVDSFFAPFPLARERKTERHDDDLFGHPAYRFWFLMKNETPMICLETAGRVWIRDDAKTYDLMNIFNQNHRRIWQTVISIAGSLMP